VFTLPDGRDAIAHCPRRYDTLEIELLLAVTEIATDRGELVLRLANDFSPVAAWRSAGAGVRMRKRPSTTFAVVRGAGSSGVAAAREAGR